MLVTKDRLLCFGSAPLFRICEVSHVEVVVLDERASSDQRNALLSDALMAAVAWAKDAQAHRRRGSRLFLEEGGNGAA